MKKILQDKKGLEGLLFPGLGLNKVPPLCRPLFWPPCIGILSFNFF